MGGKANYTEVGKILAKLRVDYCETLKRQSARLGMNQNYISCIQNGSKPVTEGFYKSVVEHYQISDGDKEILLGAFLSDDIKKRFNDFFGEGKISTADIIWLVYGFKDKEIGKIARSEK